MAACADGDEGAVGGDDGVVVVVVVVASPFSFSPSFAFSLDR